MIKLLIIIGIVIGIGYFIFSSKTFASPKANSMDQNEDTISANEWQYAYFFGITKFPLEKVGLNQSMTTSLIRMVGVDASVNTGALIAPKYMLNSKGVTPWLAMHLSSMTNKEMLKQTLEGKAGIYIPNEIIQNIFVNHVNWPEKLLSEYNIELDGFNVFILPFMFPVNLESNLTFNQSMKAPDGSLEIFGVDIFDENKPERLLARIQSELQFVRQHRPDVYEN